MTLDIASARKLLAEAGNKCPIYSSILFGAAGDCSYCSFVHAAPDLLEAALDRIAELETLCRELNGALGGAVEDEDHWQAENTRLRKALVTARNMLFNLTTPTVTDYLKQVNTHLPDCIKAVLDDADAALEATE